MNANVGLLDRRIRLGGGAVAGTAALALLGTPAALPLGLVSIVLLATGLTRRCPAYRAVGVSTRRTGAAEEPASVGSRKAVSASQALELLGRGAVLVDVRERDEWRSGHPSGAVHIPLGRIDTARQRVAKDRDVLLICRSGARSGAAARQLRAAGFHAASVRGGVGAWERAGGTMTR